MPAGSVRPAETDPDGSAGLAQPAEPEEDFGAGSDVSSAASLTGAISGVSASFSSIFARSILVVSAPEPPEPPADASRSMSTVVSSRPDLAAETLLAGFFPDLPDPDSAAGFLPAPSASGPDPPLFLPGSVLTCPPGLAAR